MGRNSKFPLELNDLMCIPVKNLGIKENTEREGMLTYKNKRIEYAFLARENDGMLRLKHEDGNKCFIPLRPVRSNLGCGVYYVFVCPVTRKVCTKLYFYNGKFQHQSNIPVNYSKQNQSKKNRLLERIFRYELSIAGDDMMKPYAKTHYRGLPTKRYLRILRTVEKEREFYYSQIQAFTQNVSMQHSACTGVAEIQ